MMKKLLALFLILLFCFSCLCACVSNEQQNDFSNDLPIEQISPEQCEKVDEYLIENWDYKGDWYYEDIISYYVKLCDECGYQTYEGDCYEDTISYYENLCDEYGYQTYEGVYCPELWKFYVDTELDVYHNDWLCQYFNHEHKYYCTTQVGSWEKYTPCSSCQGTETVYLDEEDSIYHFDKKNLELRTEDFISVKVNYRLVSEENAIQNGYRQCDCCN